jgi:hypothetical protein
MHIRGFFLRLLIIIIHFNSNFCHFTSKLLLLWMLFFIKRNYSRFCNLYWKLLLLCVFIIEIIYITKILFNGLEDCFRRCSSLISIIVPISVKFIGSECFSGCLSLQNIFNSWKTKDHPDTFIQCCF